MELENELREEINNGLRQVRDGGREERRGMWLERGKGEMGWEEGGVAQERERRDGMGGKERKGGRMGGGGGGGGGGCTPFPYKALTLLVLAPQIT